MDKNIVLNVHDNAMEIIEATQGRCVPSTEPSPILGVAYLGFGSNLGNKRENIEKAIKMLEEHDAIKIDSISSFYTTEPVGLKEQPYFLNAAAKIITDFKPLEFLSLCQNIENSLHRVRTVRWGPRTIDIDILLFDNLIINSGNLTIPHPEMHKREFVLKPLCDIAPSLIHPVFGKTILELLEQLEKFNRRNPFVSDN